MRAASRRRPRGPRAGPQCAGQHQPQRWARRRRAAASDRGDQDRERLPRRAPDRVELEVADLAAPDEPRPRVVGEGGWQQQRDRGDGERTPRRRRGVATTGVACGRDGRLPGFGPAAGQHPTGPATTTRHVVTRPPRGPGAAAAYRAAAREPHRRHLVVAVVGAARRDRTPAVRSVGARRRGRRTAPHAGRIDARRPAPRRARSTGKRPELALGRRRRPTVPGTTSASPRNSATHR